MSFALLALSHDRPAQAQGGYPGGGSGYPGGGSGYPGGGSGYPGGGSGYPGGGSGYPGGGSGYPGGGSGYPGGGSGYPGSSGGWVPSDSNGNPLSGNNGPTPLLPGVGTGDPHSTYPVPANAPDFWLQAFSPNRLDGGDGSDGYVSTGLSLFSHADNFIQDMSYYGHGVGTYAPWPYDPSEWTGSQAKPPDLIGEVTDDNKAPLTAYFVWTGAGAVPDHASFLVQTHLGASASASYGGSGKTSGLTGTSLAKVEDFGEQVAADASSNPNPDPVNGRHLVRVSVSGNLATVTVNGEVKTDANNGLPYSQFSPGHDEGGTSYYPPSYNNNGPTSASASADVSATANYDSREVTITSDIETSYSKGAVDAQHPTGQWPHTLSADGSMEVDAGVIANTGVLGGGGYHANVTYTANKVGFLNEGDLIGDYQWSHPGGTTGETQTPADKSINVDYNFSAPTDSSPLGLSSTTSVTVPDDDGATASSTYTVHWHYPYENWSKNGQHYELAPLKYTSDSGSVAANGQAHVAIPSDSIDYSIPSKIGGGVLATGVALFAPELDPLVAGFLTAAGYTASLQNPPSGHDFYGQGNAAQLSKDVDRERDIEYNGTCYDFMPSTQRMQDSLANDIYNSRDYNGYASGGHGPPGLFFTVTVYQHKWHQDYLGDAYDGHGYAGQAPGYVNWTGGYEYVYLWTLG